MLPVFWRTEVLVTRPYFLLHRQFLEEQKKRLSLLRVMKRQLHHQNARRFLFGLDCFQREAGEGEEKKKGKAGIRGEYNGSDSVSTHFWELTHWLWGRKFQLHFSQRGKQGHPVQKDPVYLRMGIFLKATVVLPNVDVSPYSGDKDAVV